MIDVRWSEEDQEYVATHPSYPSLSWLDADPDEARRGLKRLMADEGLTMTKDEALQAVMDAADCWARELVDYIAPASEDFRDDESAANQRENADEIWEAIKILGGRDGC